MRSLSLLALAVGSNAVATENKVNPIRKVVTMLQMMQNKVTAEGKKKQEIYDKFMCYCDNADTLLGGAITEAENKIPMLESAIGEDGNLKKQLDADIKQHREDLKAAKDAIATATALREKEAAAFAKESGDLKTNVGALQKAIPAIEKGMGGFLQTKSAVVLQQLSISMDMSNVDRQMLTAFLTGKAGYAPQSGEIVGILKTMLDEMDASLADAIAAENAAIAAYEELKAAKTKEINALQAAIESKMTRVGELGVKVAEMVNDLEDTKEDLAESKKFLADLDVNCENKKKEWSLYQKMQGEELLALADTIKILNDDDALELFKKTLPGSAASSLLQVEVSAKAAAQKALAVLKTARKGNDPRVDFLEIALRGGKVGFEKIIKLIDELVVQLKKEQQEDDQKKDYCDAEFDKTEDKKKTLTNEESDLETAIDDATESIGNLKAEIESLDDGIRALDKEVEEATETRKEEHEDYVASSAANKATVDILKFAKNRLNKFYNPSQYKPPPKRELSEEERITLNMGGTLAPTEAPGGIAGTGISVGLIQRHTAAPPPPPEANLAYKTKGEESAGVIQMIDNLVNDVEKDMQEAELEEKDAQGDYEKFMDDAGAKRAEDSKSMTDKEAALADTEAALVENKEKLKNKQTELMETEKYLGELHAECDWLLKYYDVRKEARTGEIDAMGKAKDVLNGADYSF
jgi:chromosome segregation ATPase